MMPSHDTDERPRVHFHSDSPFFSGSENMLAVLLNDPSFAGEFRATLGYRRSPAYEEGLRRRVHGEMEEMPLRLLDVPAVTAYIQPAPLRYLVKAVFHLLFVKYVFVAVNARRLARVFRGRGIDILHVNNGGYPGTYSCLAAVLAARRAGIERVVFVVNNVATPYDSPRRWLDRPIDLRVARDVTVFVTGSRFAADSIRDLLGLAADKVVTIPNGIAPRPVSETAEETRRRLGVPEGRPLVVQVANFERRKGQRYLLDALARLKAEGASPVPFAVLEGEGPDWRGVRAKVAELGLDDDVLLPGRERNVFDLMAGADMVVLPSIANEDFPNVVLEAMSLAKPVVASRIAGTAEQVVDGVTGLLVPPADAVALAVALGALVADPERRKRMGHAGRARFRERFEAGVAVEAYSELYRRLLVDASAKDPIDIHVGTVQ